MKQSNVGSMKIASRIISQKKDIFVYLDGKDSDAALLATINEAVQTAKIKYYTITIFMNNHLMDFEVAESIVTYLSTLKNYKTVISGECTLGVFLIDAYSHSTFINPMTVRVSEDKTTAVRISNRLIHFQNKIKSSGRSFKQLSSNAQNFLETDLTQKLVVDQKTL